ncbi:alanine racemase [bacterium]|nr:alanine racemase [bacterium]
MVDSNVAHVLINKEKLAHNLEFCGQLCKKQGIELAFVTKSICADPYVMQIVRNSSVTAIADSRLDNMAKMEFDGKKILIRPTVPAEAPLVIEHTTHSVQCEMLSLEALNKCAESAGKTHNVLLMIDLGDLRDGIIYYNEKRILDTAEYISHSKGLNLAGVAANYNCLAGLLPDNENMKNLIDIGNKISHLYNTDKPIISGGNSSSTYFLTNPNTPVPKGITQFRMGEAVVLGRNPADDTFVEGLYNDAFVLNVPLIDVQSKADKKASPQKLRRGVLAIGNQDTQIHRLVPVDRRIKIIGSCSDECVVDLSLASEDYKAGDMVSFIFEYGALMTLFASPFVKRIYG